MSDWDADEAPQSSTGASNAKSSSDQKPADGENQGYRRRRNLDEPVTDGDSNRGSGYRRDSSGGGRGGFNRDNSRGSFNRDNSRGGGRGGRGGGRGGFRDRSNSQGGGGFRRNNDNQDTSQNDNANDGNRRRRNFDQNDGNQAESNQGAGGGYQRRRNNDESADQQQGGDAPRRRRNDDQNDGGERRRGNDQGGDAPQGGERRRRNRDDAETGGNEAFSRPIEVAEGEKPKEFYRSRVYNKDDADIFESCGEGINFSKFDNIPVQVSGENIPDPLQKFSEAAKHESLIEAIKKSGYHTLTPVQKYGIAIINGKRDLMASAQTGSGKTVAFLLPIVQNLLNDKDSFDYPEKASPQCLVVTPTRELAIQIYEQALKLTFKNDLRPSVVYGGANFGDQRNRLARGSNIVIATPGRLIHFIEKEMMSLEKLKYFVLDEADRMIDQGFIPSVRRVVEEFDMPKERHTSMFSATFPSEVQRLAQQFLKPDYVFLSVGVLGAANEDVKQEVREVSFRQKKDELVKVLNEVYSDTARILIFCEKKKMADFLAATLCDRDFKTTSIHGDRLQSQREQALNSFKKGQTPILVATAVAARGLDIKGVQYVINYDLPSEIEEYVHRIGRTGRVGNAGTAISFYCPNDNSALASKLVKVLIEAKQEVPHFLASYKDDAMVVDSGEIDERRNNADNPSEFEHRTDSYAHPVAPVEEDDW